MPVYEYEALLSNGKTDRGIMDAESESAVRNRLRSSDKYPVKIRQTKTKSGGTDKGSFSQLSIFDRIKPGEVHVMTRQLATLLGAGIPLDTALTSIIEQAENSSFKKVVAQLKESISEGETLSQSLGRYQRLFPNMYINMVRAGEASGSLDRVLSRLADFGEKQEALLARLRAALIYPAFMAIVGMGILFILVTYVVPNITQVFEEMEKALPWPTVVLISISSFLQQYWWAVVILCIGLFFLIKLAIRQKSGKQAWDLVKLRAPILGAVMRKAILARFSSSMESLLGSGVGIIESLEIVKRIIDNSHISQVIDQAIEDINKGRSMANAFSGSPWFPPMFVQMVAVGERSGQLEEMLTKVSDASERDVEAAVLGMTSLIEPIMIVGMGLAVGLIVLSILLPIFEMNQMIG